jgi:predicted nucleotidyltransferase
MKVNRDLILKRIDKIKRYFLSRKEKQKIEIILRDILERKEEIVFAYIFGSFLDDLFFRDIDVGVYLKNISKKEAFNYELELGCEIESKIKIPVDLKIINFAPLYFQFHILQGKILFIKDEELWANFLDLTLRKYLDFKPLREEFLKEFP